MIRINFEIFAFFIRIILFLLRLLFCLDLVTNITLLEKHCLLAFFSLIFILLKLDVRFCLRIVLVYYLLHFLQSGWFLTHRIILHLTNLSGPPHQAASRLLALKLRYCHSFVFIFINHNLSAFQSIGRIWALYVVCFGELDWVNNALPWPLRRWKRGFCDIRLLPLKWWQWRSIYRTA